MFYTMYNKTLLNCAYHITMYPYYVLLQLMYLIKKHGMDKKNRNEAARIDTVQESIFPQN